MRLLGVDGGFTEVGKHPVANVVGVIQLHVGRLHRLLVRIALRIFQEMLVHPQQLIVLPVEAEHPQGPKRFRVDEYDLVTIRMFGGLGVDLNDMRLTFPSSKQKLRPCHTRRSLITDH